MKMFLFCAPFPVVLLSFSPGHPLWPFFPCRLVEGASMLGICADVVIYLLYLCRVRFFDGNPVLISVCVSGGIEVGIEMEFCICGKFDVYMM